uniref:Uncharacterized protein n=1 Tax=Nelumbo nucifera TaxID=4432 RepID=A0A822Z0Q2_NELNU|nr:TPA_asm: hypothetical protein HUJ06_008988 [Nelumbo nucifera]
MIHPHNHSQNDHVWSSSKSSLSSKKNKIRNLFFRFCNLFFSWVISEWLCGN